MTSSDIEPVGVPERSGPDGLVGVCDAPPDEMPGTCSTSSRSTHRAAEREPGAGTVHQVAPADAPSGVQAAPTAPDVVRLRLQVAYDGAGFCGWARQPGLRSVQGELEAALRAALRIRAEIPVRVAVAGRTDAGVHATGQVCHADVPADAWLAATGAAVRSPAPDPSGRSATADSDAVPSGAASGGTASGVSSAASPPGTPVPRAGAPGPPAPTAGRESPADDAGSAGLPDDHGRARDGRGAGRGAEHRRGAAERADDLRTHWVLRRCNGLLDHDLRIRALDVAPEGFDARWSGAWRRYRYLVADHPAGQDPRTRGHVLWHPRPLEVEAMVAAAAPFVGEHDFAAFCRARPGASSVRTIHELSWVRVSPADDTSPVMFEVRADAFCHSMVRSLVGAFLAVGDGRWPVARPAELLEAAQRVPVITVAPAHPLTLVEVGYPPNAELGAQARRARRWRGR